MAARAIWKGVLHVGDERVPVKLYSAVESGAGAHFRLLHEPDLQPVEQKMVNPVTGDIVPHERTRRAWETDDGRLVVLDDEDLESLEPEASRDIELVRFLPAGAIGHGWYDRPYYLGPDGKEEAYAAVIRALEEEEREGVARWVMRKKWYVGALRVEEGRLMMVTLRNAGEVVSAADVEAPGGRKLDERELKMAEQLVSLLEGPFEPEAFRDEYRDRVLELVEAKASGKTVRIEEYRKPRMEEGALADALKASLEAAKERRSA